MSIKRSNSEIDSSTIAAYRSAHYVVFADNPFTLRVGEISTELADLLSLKNVSCAAFITACNPFSNICTENDNLTAQNALLSDLLEIGFYIIPGIGKDPDGLWPGEQSFLALGISLEQATILGSKYGQNAIIWIDSDLRPSLVLLQ